MNRLISLFECCVSSVDPIYHNPTSHTIMKIMDSSVNEFEQASEEGKKDFYLMPVPGVKSSLQNTLDEILSRLSKQDSKIAEQDSKIIERDSKIAEQDSKIIEQDSKIAEQDSKITTLIHDNACMGAENVRFYRKFLYSRCILICGQVLTASRDSKDPETQRIVRKHQNVINKFIRERHCYAHPSTTWDEEDKETWQDGKKYQCLPLDIVDITEQLKKGLRD